MATASPAAGARPLKRVVPATDTPPMTIPPPLRRALLVPALALLLAAGPSAATPPRADWNETGIDWVDYETGMDRIGRSGRAGVLVFYTNWCPHCTLYSGVFHDPAVVALAREFVMMRVDRDAAEQLNARYAQQGSYVPRTLFVDGRGEVAWHVAGSNPKYPHFLDTRSPDELIALMERVAGAD